MKAPTMTQSGILLVDKPQGITSHDAVARTRKLAGTRKVGHAGTLDPMATGPLVLGINSSTRLLTFVVGLEKEYFATVRLSQSTDTDDADGQTVAVTDASHLDDARLTDGLASFVGEISQVPSSVSAIRVDGKRAYDLVRAGEQVELAARTVTISAIDVLDIRRVAGGAADAAASGPGSGHVDVDIRVACSSGTYIRAIARDLGDLLGVGGHLTALRRSRIGPFSVEDAVVFSPQRDGDEGVDVVDRMSPPADIARLLFPVRELAEPEIIDLVHGKRIPAGDLTNHTGPIAAISEGGTLVGLVETVGSRLKPIVNFPTDEVLA